MAVTGARRLAAGIAILAAIACGPARAHPALRGVNLSGAEFGTDKLPGVANKDYVYPTVANLDEAARLGMTAIRLPFLWERLQPVLGGPLDEGELLRIDRVVSAAGLRRLTVVLDPHDYGSYRGQPIGSAAVPAAAFAAFWKALATHYRADPTVAFGLMNEPVKQDADAWAAIAGDALRAIRQAGAKQLVLVPGTNWTGAHSWFDKRGSQSNAEALAGLTDPAGNMAIEVHQYFDADSSGTHPSCPDPAAGERAIDAVSTWLRDTGHQGFLGEFGASAEPACLQALDRTLSALDARAGLWKGWTYWTAGDWYGDYMFDLLPKPPKPRPQLAVVQKYLTP